MTLVLITHDLGVVAEHTDHVIVMYAARVVESAPVASIFTRPRHPYTRGLLQSIPRRREPGDTSLQRRLPTIDGLVPDLAALPSGCRFADRCPLKIDECTTKEPELVSVPDEAGPHESRCLRASEL